MHINFSLLPGKRERHSTYGLSLENVNVENIVIYRRVDGNVYMIHSFPYRISIKEKVSSFAFVHWIRLRSLRGHWHRYLMAHKMFSGVSFVCII